MKKILVLTNYPVSYRLPLYNKLYDIYGKHNIRFLFLEGNDNNKKTISFYSGNDFHNVSEIISQNSKLGISYRIIKLLLKYRPNIIIVGGFPYYVIPLCFISFFIKADLYNWWGGTVLSEKNISSIKKIYRLIFSKFFTGGIFYSKLAEDYFKTINPKIKRSFILGNNTQDADFIYSKYSVIKQKCQNNGKVIFISVGFQSDNKNTIVLLQACILLKDFFNDFEIQIIGGGEELQILIEFARNNQLPVKFWGFKQPNETLEIMSQSDVFIHPSKKDRWPQTYTEAICLGLPVLISNKSGVCDDYVNEFPELVLFDPLRVDEIARKMLLLIENKEIRKKLADKAKQVALSKDGISGAYILSDFLERNC